MPWVRAHYRRPRGSKNDAGCLLGILVLAGLGISIAVIRALVQLLMTPWPWIGLCLYGAYILTPKLLALHRRKRLELAVLEVVGAQLDGDASHLQECLARLNLHASDDEAACLLAAHLAQRAEFDDALAILKPLEDRASPISSRLRLVLQFPGTALPLALAEQPSAREAARQARDQILRLAHTPEQVFDSAHPPPSPELAEHLRAARFRLEAAEREAEARRQTEAAEQHARRVRQRAEEERARIEAAERAMREAVQHETDAAARASAKIRSAKTSAGRRSALQDGLAVVTSPELRQQLLVEVARAEVEAVLTKASTLKTAKAKRRHLEDALSALRTDSVPDELQAREIAILEQALAELGPK